MRTARRPRTAGAVGGSGAPPLTIVAGMHPLRFDWIARYRHALRLMSGPIIRNLRNLRLAAWRLTLSASCVKPRRDALRAPAGSSSAGGIACRRGSERPVARLSLLGLRHQVCR